MIRRIPRKHVFRGACLGLLCLLAVVFAAHARAAPPPTMDEANRAFGEGRYDEASAGFEQLVEKNGYSLPLLFNLGNSYLRAGKPVRAMLAYERAQILAPRDPAVQENLAVARTAAMAPDDSGQVTRLAHTLSMNTWSWLAAGGVWLTVACFAGGMFSKTYRALLVAIAVCGAMTVAASSAALVVSSADLHRALVMAPAPVFVSPFKTAQSDFALSAGSSVELGPERDQYVFVRDATGRTGWLERTQAERLIPRRS
jgi:hypothetical protein